MPMHDWTRVPSGLFHHFHQDWSIEIARALNRGCLPKGLAALVEQRADTREGDVLAIGTYQPATPVLGTEPPVLTLDRPTTRIVQRTPNQAYAVRANRVVVRHHLGRIVSVIEIVSPGNKDNRAAVRHFVDKRLELLRKGVHLLVLDLFPPTPRDPHGLHPLIWDELGGKEVAFPAGKDRLLASYEAGTEYSAYVEPLAVGDKLPSMPLYVARELFVRVPLEATYRETWAASPEALREAVETGVLPDPDAE